MKEFWRIPGSLHAPTRAAQLNHDDPDGNQKFRHSIFTMDHAVTGAPQHVAATGIESR
jgi:hypothetical protein